MTDSQRPPVLPRRVGVLGGGRMGAGIAHAFLLHGCNVVVVERDQDSAEAAGRRVRDAVAESIRRGVTNRSAAEFSGRLTLSVDEDWLAGRELVIEAVPESRDLKAAALRGIESRLAADAFLASTTSSLSIDTLAEGLARPENFLGLHFFNPVPASALIEVVAGKRTRPELIAAAKGWAEALGKTAVLVNDAPGFASSRLGVAIALEAMRMLEEGVASAEDIDAAMVLGYKHPAGPLRTTDIVGLDVRLNIAQYLQSRLGDRFAPPQILQDKVSRGELGRKSGRGFFDWPSQRLD